MNLKKDQINKQQYEIAYVLYMIIGSYFEKCYCRSVVMEERLYLYYQEMSQTKQTSLERKIIYYFERNFKKLKEQIEGLRCNTYIYYKNGSCVIYFKTGFEDIIVKVDQNEKYEIQYYIN
jgi:hypothetical protein